MMLGKKHWAFWVWWRASWFVISPLLILAILLWSLVSFSAPTYGDVQYPQWSVILGWCTVAFALIWIPIMAIVAMYKAHGNILQKFRTACRPDPSWGPYLNKHRTGRYGPHPEEKKENASDQSPLYTLLCF
uniref:sodium- and chloride-dependent neutral and basic amino acid transporter B(0+)-like n=1 Tax=Myxine glutinosa TaxID=7769 RepID=UPI0035900102